MRALASRCLEHAGAQALAAHFHQAEARDATDLDAGAIVLQRLLHRLLDLPDVGAIVHVDEVDDDEAGHVAQAQLARDLVRGLEVGRGRGLLDAVLAGRAAGVDVDRDERLGRVDHQIAARFQLDDRVVHRGELFLDMAALEQRHRIGIMLHLAGMARHQELHELLGLAIALPRLRRSLRRCRGCRCRGSRASAGRCRHRPEPAPTTPASSRECRPTGAPDNRSRA